MKAAKAFIFSFAVLMAVSGVAAEEEPVLNIQNGSQWEQIVKNTSGVHIQGDYVNITRPNATMTLKNISVEQIGNYTLNYTIPSSSSSNIGLMDVYHFNDTNETVDIDDNIFYADKSYKEFRDYARSEPDYSPNYTERIMFTVYPDQQAGASVIVHSLQMTGNLSEPVFVGGDPETESKFPWWVLIVVFAVIVLLGVNNRREG